jgi:hypothetical protein
MGSSCGRTRRSEAYSPVPTIALLLAEGAVEADLDLALRVATELGGSPPILPETT